MTDDYEDIERDEFNIKLANEMIDRVAPSLIRELGRLPSTAQQLAMGTIIGEWLCTLGNGHDEVLDEISIYARGYRDGKAEEK